MKKFNHLAIAMLLAAGAPLAHAEAGDKADEMWAKFYIRMASIIRAGDKDANMMVCLNNPGIPLTPLDSSKPADQDYVNELLDTTAEYNPVYTKGKTPFSKIYGDILAHAKSDPGKPLTPAQKAQLEAAYKLTNPKGPVKLKYDTYEDEYDEAITAREAVRWENLAAGKGLTNPRTYDTKVNRIMDAWESDGRKSEVQTAQRTITEFSSTDPKTWWNANAKNFSDAKTGSFYKVSTFPPMDKWTADDGWMDFTYKATDTKSKASANSMDIAASMALKKGCFDGSASGSYNKAASEAMANDSTLTISMQIKKVIINRPWMDWQVFLSDKWEWSNPMVSDGKGKGSLPLYTDSMIIVRNVKFHARSIASFKKAYMEEIKVKAQAKIGPFSMNFNFAKKDSSSEAALKDDEQTITFADPQIIAFGCTVVPKCPAKTVK